MSLQEVNQAHATSKHIKVSLIIIKRQMNSENQRSDMVGAGCRELDSEHDQLFPFATTTTHYSLHGNFSAGLCDRGLKPTRDVFLMPRLKTRGSLLPLAHIPYKLS
jgi:hypothetical protein